MSLEVQFFFYLAAVVCFVLAALGPRVRAQVAFVPLGLALFRVPDDVEHRGARLLTSGVS